MKDGDKNTNFFHSITISRRKNNRNEKVKNNDGKWVDNREDIGKTLCENLKKMMMTSRGGTRNFV